MYAAVRQCVLAVPLEEAWSLVSEPAHLEQWFADVEELAPEKAFRFEFGDGDAFYGQVVDWRPPRRLHLEWRFLDVGPRFQILILLNPMGGSGTEVTVVDQGALSVVELESLREGWSDFLQRLEHYAASGERTRYAWSESIGLGGLLPVHEDGFQVPELADVSWWRARFDDAMVEPIGRSGSSLELEIRDARWDGVTTRAEVSVEGLECGVYIGVVHRGWPALPERQQLPERRRFVELWRRALAELESKYR